MIDDDLLDRIAATYEVDQLLDLLDMSINELVYILREQIEERRDLFKEA